MNPNYPSRCAARSSARSDSAAESSLAGRVMRRVCAALLLLFVDATDSETLRHRGATASVGSAPVPRVATPSKGNVMAKNRSSALTRASFSPIKPGTVLERDRVEPM